MTTYNNFAPATGEEEYSVAMFVAQFVNGVSTSVVMNVTVGSVSLRAYAVIS